MRIAMSNARSHIHRRAQDAVAKLYGFADLPPGEVKTKVNALLANDAFMCHADERESDVSLFKQPCTL